MESRYLLLHQQNWDGADVVLGWYICGNDGMRSLTRHWEKLINAEKYTRLSSDQETHGHSWKARGVVSALHRRIPHSGSVGERGEHHGHRGGRGKPSARDGSRTKLWRDSGQHGFLQLDGVSSQKLSSGDLRHGNGGTEEWLWRDGWLDLTESDPTWFFSND